MPTTADVKAREGADGLGVRRMEVITPVGDGRVMIRHALVESLKPGTHPAAV